MLLSTLAFSPRFCYFPRGRSFPGCTRMNRYATAGMVMLLVGRLPQTADRCEWEGWRFEVMDMDGKRIDKVLATSTSSAPADIPQLDEPAR